MRPPFYVAIVLSIACVIALLELPYAYYQFLRWGVCGGSAFLAYTAFTQYRMVPWAAALGVFAFLFNPIFPFYLDRGAWMIIDAMAAGAFAIFAWNYRSKVLEWDELTKAAFEGEQYRVSEIERSGREAAADKGRAASDGSSPLVVDKPLELPARLYVLAHMVGIDASQRVDMTEFAAALSAAVFRRVLYLRFGADQPSEDEGLDWKGILLLGITDALSQRLKVDWYAVMMTAYLEAFLTVYVRPDGEIDADAIEKTNMQALDLQPILSSQPATSDLYRSIGGWTSTWLSENDEAALQSVANNLDAIREAVREAQILKASSGTEGESGSNGRQ